MLALLQIWRRCLGRSLGGLSVGLVGPEEVKRCLRTVNSATYSLDPCLSWLVEVAQGLSCEHVLAVGNSFLSEEIVPLLLKDLCFTPSSRSHCWSSPHWTIIIQLVSKLPFFGKLMERLVVRELWRKKIIWSLPIRIQTQVWDINCIGHAFGWPLA